jgi:16S rRNA (adenine1518-N6/adenine1519-N6)-dimethyltransferase
MPARPPKSVLVEHGLRPKRSFGQNFLTDPAIARRIAELAAPDGATVIELGAGLGALTRPLLERAARVIAIERDRDLVPLLQSELAGHGGVGQLTVLEADAKSIDPAALLEGTARPHVLCGNLPYQITGPLLTLTTRAASVLDRAVFLVQLEVANRLAADPGTHKYGALSVFVQAAFQVNRALVVRRGAFFPQPNVDSAVVSLIPREVPIPETPVFAALVRAAFGQRRKKLANAWRSVPGLDSASLASAALAAEIDLDDRGERLSVADFARMADAVERTTG